MRTMPIVLAFAAATAAIAGPDQPPPAAPGKGLGKFTAMPTSTKMMPEDADANGMVDRDGKWMMGNLPASDAQIAEHKAMMARRKAAPPK